MYSNLVIGIDPGKTTGVALLDKKKGELLELKSMTFWSAMNYCILSSAATVIVEVPETRAVWSGGNATGKAKIKVATNVGGTIREAELMVEGLELAGKKVIRVHPIGKLDAEQFNRMTGWTGSSNEHTRDAGRMAFQWRRGGE